MVKESKAEVKLYPIESVELSNLLKHRFYRIQFVFQPKKCKKSEGQMGDELQNFINSKRKELL